MFLIPHSPLRVFHDVFDYITSPQLLSDSAVFSTQQTLLT